MKYNFRITSDFARDFKRLAKSRKTLPDDFDQFLQAFNHTQGDTIPGAQAVPRKFAWQPLAKASVGAIELFTISLMRILSISLKSIVRLYKKLSLNLRKDVFNNLS